MNTGERIWWVPIGHVAENIANHPALRDVDTSRFGGGGNSVNMVAGDLLYTTEGSNGPPVLNAWNKLTGEHVGEIELPGSVQYGMMTYEHEGQQTIVVQSGRPARLIALRLPG